MVDRKTEKISDTVDSKYLPTCDLPLEDDLKADTPFTLVLFGGAGDLSKKKLLPSIFSLYQKKMLSEEFSILGFARTPRTNEEFRKIAEESIIKYSDEKVDQNLLKSFLKRLSYLSSNVDIDDNYKGLCDQIREISTNNKDNKKSVIFYFAVPSKAASKIIEKLVKHKLCYGEFDAKLVIEKPFGSDTASAEELNNSLSLLFSENQIYRIDHYLGKDTVQNILFFRFANSIFEPLWDRRYIDHVEITVAEEIGIEGRGDFYEETGIIRDIIQNHMMQLIALVAMEIPAGFEANFIRDEKAKVFNSIRPMDDDHIKQNTIWGQYGHGKINKQEVISYREEPNVLAESNTPTFFAAKLYIDNWRWAGVPFYIRSGKRMAKKLTEINIFFKQPPLRLFGRTCDKSQPNILSLKIQPDEEISLLFDVKNPIRKNQIYPVNMTFNYHKTFKSNAYSAYQRLLIDCIKGDLTLFARQDEIALTWKIIDPIISYWQNSSSFKIPIYKSGSWGPKESEELMKRDGRSWKNL